MNKAELLSKAWCELVFEGRNRSYGAYRLRRNAGKRYRIALFVVFILGLLLLLLPFLSGVFLRYDSEMKDEGVTVLHIKSLDVKKDHEIKNIAAGRSSTPSLQKGREQTIPKLVDLIPPPQVVGVEHPEDIVIGDGTFPKQQIPSLTHNAGREDLPEEGAALSPVDVVEQMPEFPGGMGQLMKWLDRNISYPQDCISEKVEGDVEVSFLVDRMGFVTEAAITKSLHHRLDSVVLQAIKKMPKWKPARVGGQVAIVQVTVPVHFEAD